MVLDQFAMTPEHRVIWTSPVLLTAGSICYGEIVIAIDPVKRLVIAVWITISGEFVEVFFHNLFNYGLVGGVWFYFFITYREMKVRLHFQFLAYKAG